MTVVAAKDGSMAADTQLTGDGINRAQKIVRLPDGGVAGGAGSWYRAWPALKWLADGEQGDGPSLDGASILILRPDGSLWMAEQEWPAYPLLDRMAAIGCGSQAAMVAMDCGLSAAEAVAKVSKYDANTSPPVQVLSIETKQKRKRRAKR